MRDMEYYNMELPMAIFQLRKNGDFAFINNIKCEKWKNKAHKM